MNETTPKDLGKRVKEYRVRVSSIIGLSTLTFILACLFGLGVYMAFETIKSEKEIKKILILIGLGMACIASLYLFIYQLLQLRKKVILFENGIKVIALRKQYQISYQDIERIYWNLKEGNGWLGIGKGSRLIIFTKEGQKLDIDEHTYLKSEELMETIEREMGFKHLEVIYEELEKGTEICFDKVFIHRDFLRIPDGYVNWCDFGGITLQNGTVYFINKEEEPFYGEILCRFPNFALFANLAQHLRENHEVHVTEVTKHASYTRAD